MTVTATHIHTLTVGRVFSLFLFKHASTNTHTNTMAEEYYYDEDTETAMEKVKRLFRENKVVAAGKLPFSPPTFTQGYIHRPPFFIWWLNAASRDTLRKHPLHYRTNPHVQDPSTTSLINKHHKGYLLSLSLSLSFTPPLTPHTSLVSPIFSQ